MEDFQNRDRLKKVSGTDGGTDGGTDLKKSRKTKKSSRQILILSRDKFFNGTDFAFNFFFKIMSQQIHINKL